MSRSRSKDAHRGHLGDRDSLEFALFSANIQHILNVSSVSKLTGIYQRTKTFQKIQVNWNPTNVLDKLSIQLYNSLSKPTFIATFHFGFYRSLVLKIVNDGYKVCIPIAKQILDSQRSYYKAILGVTRAKNIVLLDAEDPYLFFKVAKYSKLGYHTLCYLDGGSGVKTKYLKSSRSLIRVPLAHGFIFSKVAFLKFAYIANLPVVLCIHSGELYDSGGDNVIANYYPVLSNESSEAYSRRVIAEMYKDFSNLFLKNPEMWECWFYLHQYCLPESGMSNWTVENRFTSFVLKGRCYVLDKKTYQSVGVSKEKFEKLCNRKI